MPFSRTSEASMIGINFHGGTNGRKIGTKEAGVEPQTNWNDVDWWTFTALLDSNAKATAVSVTTDTTKRTYNSYVSVDPPYGGNDYLMHGYIYPSGASMTVTVAGLGQTFASHGYNVIVYFDGDNSTDWTTDYTISVGGADVATISGKDLANANFSGTFDDATTDGVGNYVRFTGLTGNTFTLTATPVAGTAPINGIQIVSAPEPLSMALLAVGLAIPLGLARKSRKSAV